MSMDSGFFRILLDVRGREGGPGMGGGGRQAHPLGLQGRVRPPEATGGGARQGQGEGGGDREGLQGPLAAPRLASYQQQVQPGSPTTTAR
jgi:hypothetical protein